MAEENKNPGYCVPLLSLDDILETLNVGLLLNLKKSDLIPGNPEKLKEIYLVILEEFHPNLSFITQQRFKDMADLSPDEMDASIVTLHIYGLLKTVLRKMNFHDVCKRDLFNPTYKRTQVILSHLINFWRFITSSREDAKGPLKEKFHELSNKKAVLITEAPTIQRKLNDAKAELVGLREVASELQHQQVIIRKELNEGLVTKDSIKRTNAEKKEMLSSVSQENKANAEELTELMYQNVRLAEKVVGSPKQLEDRVEARKQAIVNIKAEIVKAKKRLNDAMEHARNYGIWRTKVLDLSNHTAAIKEEMTFAVKAKHGDLNAIESQKQTIRENIIDMEAMYENLEASLKILVEKNTQLEHQHHMKKNSFKTQLKEAQMSEKRIMKNIDHLDIALTSATEEYAELTSRMKRAKLDFKTAENEAKSHLETIPAFDAYVNVLATYITDLEQMVDRLTCTNSRKRILEMVQNMNSTSD